MGIEPQDRSVGRPASPPTVPGPLGSVPQGPGWPMAVGVVCILFGAGAALSAAWAIAMSYLSFQMLEGTPGGAAAGAMMLRWRTWTLVGSALAMALGGVLIAAGAGIIGRRPWASGLALIWAVLKMILVVVSGILGIFMQQENLAAYTAAGAATMPAGMGPQASLMTAMAVGVAVVGLLWGLALPVFILVWFLRPKIKAEVAAWST